MYKQKTQAGRFFVGMSKHDIRSTQNEVKIRYKYEFMERQRNAAGKQTAWSRSSSSATSSLSSSLNASSSFSATLAITSPSTAAAVNVWGLYFFWASHFFHQTIIGSSALVASFVFHVVFVVSCRPLTLPLSSYSRMITIDTLLSERGFFHSHRDMFLLYAFIAFHSLLTGV